MIIIHGYRATTILLSILLNVMVRTGEYGRHFVPSDKVLSSTTWRLNSVCLFVCFETIYTELLDTSGILITFVALRSDSIGCSMESMIGF